MAPPAGAAVLTAALPTRAMDGPDFRYLRHLARLGHTGIHPLGDAGTGQVLEALNLVPGDRVLEIGCGTGGSMVSIASCARVTIHGVDLLPEMLAVARQRLRVSGLRSSSSLIHADATCLPLAASIYDGVYAESVLGFQSPQTARALLGEVHRVLRPSGRLVALDGVWKPGVSADTADAIYRSCLWDFGLSPASRQPWDVNDWVNLMRDTGFVVSEARLLDRTSPGPPENAAAPRPMRSVLSRGVTAWHGIKGRVLPRARRERRCYDQLLRRHAADREYLEVRLFVLAKPDPESGSHVPTPRG